MASETVVTSPDLDEVKLRPLDALVRDLEDRGAPSMQWTVWWGEGGDDPLARAWVSMGDLASRSDFSGARARILLWPTRIVGNPTVHFRYYGSKPSVVSSVEIWYEDASNGNSCREFKTARRISPRCITAEIVLSAVNPPTLDELLSRRER